MGSTTDSLQVAPTRYYPYENGAYEIKAGLFKLGQHPVHGQVETQVFKIDREYGRYMANKAAVHRDTLYRHYLQAACPPAQREALCRFMASRAAAEYGDGLAWDEATGVFTNRWLGWSARLDLASGAVRNLEHGSGPLAHLVADVVPVDAFDFLTMNLTEDVSLVVRHPRTQADWVALTHIAAPHHWDPRDKAGRSFAEVHAPVPESPKLAAVSDKMMRAIIEQGPFIRFAWGMAANDVLNHHSAAAHDGDREQAGHEERAELAGMFVRVERQILWGLPEVDAVMFTIRPYWYPLADLRQEPERLRQLAAGVRSMTDEHLAYKGMTERLQARLADYLDQLVAG
jgi:hypothetical protein